MANYLFLSRFRCYDSVHYCMTTVPAGRCLFPASSADSSQQRWLCRRPSISQTFFLPPCVLAHFTQLDRIYSATQTTVAETNGHTDFNSLGYDLPLCLFSFPSERTKMAKNFSKIWWLHSTCFLATQFVLHNESPFCRFFVLVFLSLYNYRLFCVTVHIVN